MKKAGEYVEDLNLLFVPMGQLGTETTVTKEDAIEAIKQAQKDAIEATLKLAAEKSKLLEESNWGRYEQPSDNPTFKQLSKFEKNNFGHGDCTYQRITIDKSSILSLKDELFKQLE